VSLSTRALNVLSENRIEPERTREMSDRELTRFRNLGRLTLAEIRAEYPPVQALPFTTTGGDYSRMTLRDYFAAKAMAALIAHPEGSSTQGVEELGIARLAYRQADEMIRVRQNEDKAKEDK